MPGWFHTEQEGLGGLSIKNEKEIKMNYNIKDTH